MERQSPDVVLEKLVHHKILYSSQRMGRYIQFNLWGFKLGWFLPQLFGPQLFLMIRARLECCKLSRPRFYSSAWKFKVDVMSLQWPHKIKLLIPSEKDFFSLEKRLLLDRVCLSWQGVPLISGRPLLRASQLCHFIGRPQIITPSLSNFKLLPESFIMSPCVLLLVEFSPASSHTENR